MGAVPFKSFNRCVQHSTQKLRSKKRFDRRATGVKNTFAIGPEEDSDEDDYND
jgi:hypothetical protein